MSKHIKRLYGYMLEKTKYLPIKELVATAGYYSIVARKAIAIYKQGVEELNYSRRYK